MLNAKKAEKIFEKSRQVLREVQMPNGGLMATPKGKRYPYIYPRDHSIITLALIEAGMMQEARKAVGFIVRAEHGKGAFPQRLTPEGKDASYKPVQIDGTALAIISFARFYRKSHDKRILQKHWKRMQRAANYIVANIDADKKLVFTPNSIFEFPPLEQGLEVWANGTCYAALGEMEFLARQLGKGIKKFSAARQGIKKGCEKFLWTGREKRFLKKIRLRESSSVVVTADASTYALAEFGMFSDNDKRIVSTVQRIEKELWYPGLGGICRYPKALGRNNGGFGPWAIFTCMLARHFIRRGKRKQAEKYFGWVMRNSENGLLPEHVAKADEFEEYVLDYSSAGLLRPDRKVLIQNVRKQPMFKKKGIAFVTMPLAWSHAEFILTWSLFKKRFLQGKKGLK